MKHDFKYLDYEIKYDYLGNGRYRVDARNYFKNDFLSFLVEPIMSKQYLKHDLSVSIKNYINKHEKKEAR